jgi:hypothetical protein
MEDICQEPAQAQGEADLEGLGVIEDELGKCLPLQLGLGAHEKENVPVGSRRSGVEKLILRPDNSPLNVVDDSNLRTRLGKDKELFGLNLGARLRVPLPHEGSQGARGNFGGVVPAGKRGQEHRIPKLRAVQLE